MFSKIKLIVQHSKIVLVVISITLILVGTLSLYLSYPRLENVKLSKPDGSVKIVDNLPILISPSVEGKYTVDGNLQINRFSQKKFKIIPDNCLQSLYINDQQVDLNMPASMLCDLKNGFTLDLSDKLKDGNNKIQFNVKDDGGAMLLLIYSSLDDPIFFILSIMVVLCVLILVGVFLLKNKWNYSLILLFLVGIVIRITYLSYTHFNLRTHDVDGHIDYINFLLENHRLPDSKACWQCYQPPVYYTLASVLVYIWRFFKLDFIFDSYLFLQTVSVFFYSVFCYYGVQIIRTVFQCLKTSKFLLFSASSMFILWPVGIIHSVRIGNDLLLYPLYAAGLYYLILWWQKNQSKDLYKASVLSILAVLTKSNGAVLVLIILLCLAFKFWLSRQQLWDDFVSLMKHFKANKTFDSRKKELLRAVRSDFVYIIEIIVAGIIFIFGGLALYAKAVYAGDKELIGNSGGLNSALAVKNNLENYLFFDVKDFLTIPFASPWVDEGGRQYFFNYFFKTSLFGEFQVENFLNKNLAILLSFLLFVAIVVVCYFLAMLNLEKVQKHLPLILNLLILPISLAYIRSSYPFSPSNDFRYVVPFLISFVVFYFLTIKDFKRSNLISNLLIILPLVFSIVSLVFFLIPVLWIPQIY
ncbi:MAG: hypothetical protein WCK98_02325 [bacterium]